MLDFRAETSQLAGRSITVLGATGSIGQSTFDVIRRSGGRFRVFGMAARAQHEALGPLVQEFKPRVVVLFEEDAALQLRRALGPGHSTQVLQGMNGLIEAVTAAEVDHVVCGIGGAVGLQPLWSALAAGKVVSIANKEPLVLAGALLMRVAREHQACILPLDSEHHAIFRCLQGQPSETVRRVVLTASGGAFRDWPLERFSSIQPADALKHPTWTMGAKITVDSATMMNKGLEIIEAHHLFGLPQEQIEVCIHRQSAVHGMVEFDDGTWLAQMAAADMRVPIRHCLEHPRLEHPQRGGFDLPAWDPVVAGRLDFEAVDARRYPCLAVGAPGACFGSRGPCRAQRS